MQFYIIKLNRICQPTKNYNEFFPSMNLNECACFTLSIDYIKDQTIWLPWCILHSTLYSLIDKSRDRPFSFPITCQTEQFDISIKQKNNIKI